MSAVDNAAVALDKGVGTVESIINWFVANREDLPVGLAVAAGIVALMLGIRWAGSWMFDVANSASSRARIGVPGSGRIHG